MRKRRITLLPIVILVLIVSLIKWSALPPLGNRAVSAELSTVPTTQLGRNLASEIKAHPEKSGTYYLRDARDAFTAVAKGLGARAGELWGAASSPGAA